MLHAICYMNLDTPIQNISRILPAYQKRLAKLGIKNLRDLFYHFPSRYDDFSNISDIVDLKFGETATVQGKIIGIKNIRTWKKRMSVTEAYLRDKTGAIKAVWFNQPFLLNTLKSGSLLSVSGKVKFDKIPYFSNPAYERLLPDAHNQTSNNLRHTGGLIPVYPETAGLSSRYLRYLLKVFLPATEQMADWLPPEIKKSQKLSDLQNALKQVHFPASPKTLDGTKRRLAFDEIFLIQLYALQQKIKWNQSRAPQIKFDQSLVKNFVDGLPFRLTAGQRQAAWEILKDLQKNRPMNRLLEGDVGSGKTVVAAIAALQTAASGWQTALMAPTEILAQQHFKEFSAILGKKYFSLALLTGKDARIFSGRQIKKTTKKELLKKIQNGQIQIVIGTHALIQEKTKFKNLALVVIDEQHRFGVEQRAALQKNVSQMADGLPSAIPHLLSLTATPIPRSLALTIYGDLDISLLKELPAGRPEIVTAVVPPAKRRQTYGFIRQQVSAGRQAFVICPRVEKTNGGGDTLLNEVKAAKEEFQKLAQKIFPELKIALLYGSMRSAEKEKVMGSFRDGQTQILVATSVVEVGIDVPNATVMMIEGAERFGLAQLHQFRGRVGRGPHQSYCFLMAESSGAKANARLKAVLSANNGFELAEKDLALRGPGQLYGSRQWGLPDLSMASLTDLPLIKNCRLEAAKILNQDPELKNYPALKEKIKEMQMIIHLE